MPQTGTGQYTLRFAVSTDVPIILDLIRGLAKYEKLTAECIATEDLLRKNLFGDRPYAEILIGEMEGEPVGFALFFHTFSTFLGRPGIYLEDLFVKPSWRGKGLGHALLQRLAELAVERGCGRLEWAVLNWNEPAIGFYRRVGAEPLDEWTTYRLTGSSLDELANARRQETGGLD